MLNPPVTGVDNNDELTKGLYSYIYHNLHSRPYSEYRHNLKLFPLFQTTKTNIFNISSTSIRLPASGRWFLYTVENANIVSIKLPCSNEAWTCFGDYVDSKTKQRVTGFCSNSGIDVRFTLTNDLRSIPRHHVWVIKNPKANNFIIAINEAVVDTLKEVMSSVPPEVSLNVYYHKQEEYFKVVGYDCNKLTERNTFYADCCEESIYHRIIFVNGCELVPKTLEDIPTGSYGEIVYDSSIVGEFTIDFESAGDMVYLDQSNNAKLLCHIPKAYNPLNHLLNHRVCDVFVHPNKESVRSYADGLYIDRANTESLFTTITHNDFSIDRSLILQYASYLNETSACRIKVYVRDHNKGLTLEKDPNFIWSLYQLSDDTIISHLTAKTSQSQWYAATIEQSTWSKMMDNYLQGVTYTDFETCVNTLGYTNSADAICSRVQHILVSNELQREFFIPIPICFNETDQLVCHIFIDGLLVDKDLTKFRKNKQFLIITLGPDIELTVGSYITVEIFEDTHYKAQEVILLPGQSYIFNTAHDYCIYKKYPLTDDNYIDDDYIFKRFEADYSYIEFMDFEYDNYVTESYIDELASNIVEVTNIGKYALNLIVVSKYAYAKIYGVERHLKELNYDIWCSHLLTVEADQFETLEFTATTDTTASSSKYYYIRRNKKYYIAHVYTSDTVFQADKTYYLFKNDEFVVASVSTGAAVTANTYYERLESGAAIVQSTTDPIYEMTSTCDSTKLTIPYLNKDRTLLVYLNGKELIEGLDYEDYSILTNRNYSCGQFVVLQNVDYLKVVSNIFEVFTINEQLAALDTGFLTEEDGSTRLESVMSHMSLYKNIGQLFIDGVEVRQCDSTQYFAEILQYARRGAPYKIRALIPECLTDKLDAVASIDTATIAKVNEYMEENLSSSTQVTPITRSYHLYSTFLQTVTEQILRGKLKYDINWSDERIVTSLQPYLSMLKYDIGLSALNQIVTDPKEFVKPPVMGLDFRFVDVLPSYRLETVPSQSSKDSDYSEDSDLTITEKRPLMLIRDSNIEAINGNYICMNPGLDYMKDTSAKHINENAYKHWENSNGCYIEHIDNYWVLYTKEKIACYHAFDNKGIVEIWDLDWEPIGEYDDITINVMYVEVNTANEFPAHRLQNTFDIKQYAYLMRVARMYLPSDLAKDGMNI